MVAFQKTGAEEGPWKTRGKAIWVMSKTDDEAQERMKGRGLKRKHDQEKA